MKTRDLRVTGYRPLVPPAIILEELALSESGSRAVARWRDELARILDLDDGRLMAIVGPCSIHDPVAALDYARHLGAVGDELRDDLVVVMRAYFMKPRTSVGWKGLVSDPRRDGSFRINDGLRMTRRLLLDLVEIGIPAACARWIICCPSSGLVAKDTDAGIWAACRRAASAHQSSGRYNARSINAWPCAVT